MLFPASDSGPWTGRSPTRHEVLYWSSGGLRRILRPVADPYNYWLATTNAEEREIKRLMKRLYGGSVRNAIDELVRLTSRCHTTEERSAVLEPYFEGRLAKVTRDEEVAPQDKAFFATRLPG